MGAMASDRQKALHRSGIRLEDFTITWNVVEAFVAVGAGLLAGSVALVGFGVDSGIEVISAVALLWRLLKAAPEPSAEEHGAAEKRALYLVAATFFSLSAYGWVRESPSGPAIKTTTTSRPFRRRGPAGA
ncbi:MAG: hypothetical protein M3514_02310 [Actinomycetota bacterium]|nr:hypothetical protein [Rubrobacteraceae bacterium]MDQ3251834.1 hypothetical protein [Actinomycetota bacterium]MDQ3496353.1 hypothetical protein [Actinomycetota bacterium]